MPCDKLDLGNGDFAIVCSRGGERRGKPRALCSACKQREHTLLCDFALHGAKIDKTCSAKMCASCATKRDGKDLCPPHAKVADAQPLLL